MQTSWMRSGMLTGDLRDNPQVRLMWSWFKPKENIPDEEIEVLQDNGRSGGLLTDLESLGPLFVSGNCFGYLSDQPDSAFNSDLELESEEERLDNECYNFFPLPHLFPYLRSMTSILLFCSFLPRDQSILTCFPILFLSSCTSPLVLPCSTGLSHSLVTSLTVTMFPLPSM